MLRQPPSKMRMLRESRGLRQFDLAVLTHLSPATVWAAEKRGDTVSDQTRKRIADALGAPVESLFDGRD